MENKWGQAIFPKLHSANHKIDSPPTTNYNCVAWAAGDTEKVWWPKGYKYWPPSVPKEETVDAFLTAFMLLGYKECLNGAQELGYEKVALFAKIGAFGLLMPTHMSRQLENGDWTSKIGAAEDIIHQEVSNLAGPVYGHPVKYMKRLFQ